MMGVQNHGGKYNSRSPCKAAACESFLFPTLYRSYFHGYERVRVSSGSHLPCASQTGGPDGFLTGGEKDSKVTGAVEKGVRVMSLDTWAGRTNHVHAVEH